jgi:hypothetical protein
LQFQNAVGTTVFWTIVSDRRRVLANNQPWKDVVRQLFNNGTGMVRHARALLSVMQCTPRPLAVS